MLSPMEQYHAQESFDGLGSKLKKAVKKSVKGLESVGRVAKKPSRAIAGGIKNAVGRTMDKVLPGKPGTAFVRMLNRQEKSNVFTKNLEKMQAAIAADIAAKQAEAAATAIPGVSPSSIASDPALAQTINMTGGAAGIDPSQLFTPVSLPPAAEVPVSVDAGGAPATSLDAAQSAVASGAAGAPASGKGGALTLLAPAGIGFAVAGPVGAVVGLAAGAMLGKKKAPALAGFGVLDYSTATKSQLSLAQAKLKDLGFDAGPIDGLLGSKTKAGVAAFEKAWGIPVDESWPDFLSSVDVAWRGRGATSQSISTSPKAPAVTQAQAATQAAMGRPKKSGFSLPNIDFKDPATIMGIAGIGLVAVMLLLPPKSRK